MSVTIAYDLTRMFLAPLSGAPRGIDRVDLALAQFFFTATYEYEVVGVLPTPWGIRLFDAQRVRSGIAYIESLWAERGTWESDLRFEHLVERLAGNGTERTFPSYPPLRSMSKMRRVLGELAATGFALGNPVRAALPRGAAYVNIGQISLAMPVFHGWLIDRPDVTAIYMLHDVIPLEFPELVDAGSRKYHRRMVETAARHADALIVSTNHACKTVSASIRETACRDVPTYVRSLPLPEVLAQANSADPRLSDCSYFVACSTVEPRKNFGLLLEAWEIVVSRLGMKAPQLVIVGSAGRNAGEILRPMAESPVLGSRVHHVSGLSSAALARLMLGSAAVLCPSLAEGFGLSLLEANALRVPAIASDIPSHREIAQSDTILLPPDDPDRWATEIMSMEPGALRQTPPIAPELRQTAYCRDIAKFITQCASEGRRNLASPIPHQPSHSFL